MSRRRRLLAWVIALAVRGWIATLRVRRAGPPIRGPAVLAFWHGEQLPLLPARPSGILVAPISLSADGRLQARVMARLGIGEAPGSSSRGGLGAARRLIRAVRGGAVALMAVDGPRGPCQVVKPGAAFVARATGAPLHPVGVAVRRGHRLRRSWDRFLLPLPFTRVVIVFGPPVELATDAEVAIAEGIASATRAATEALG